MYKIKRPSTAVFPAISSDLKPSMRGSGKETKTSITTSSQFSETFKCETRSVPILAQTRQVSSRIGTPSWWRLAAAPRVQVRWRFALVLPVFRSARSNPSSVFSRDMVNVPRDHGLLEGNRATHSYPSSVWIARAMNRDRVSADAATFNFNGDQIRRYVPYSRVS